MSRQSPEGGRRASSPEQDREIAALVKRSYFRDDISGNDRLWNERFARNRKLKSTAVMGERGYFICFTPRSGSSWLMEMLANTGVLGRPGELLALEHPFARTTDATGLDEYVAAIRGTTTANGVFGLKANWAQAAVFARQGLFHSDDIVYVYLTREDLVMQAISLYRAAATGAWSSGDDQGAPPFDEPAISEWMRWLQAMMEEWEQAFQIYGIEPLRLTYEQLEADPVSAVRTIAGALGVDLPAKLDLLFWVERQRSSQTQEWADRVRRKVGG